MWSQGQPNDLRSLEPQNPLARGHSYAYAINDYGEIVRKSTHGVGTNHFRAFRTQMSLTGGWNDIDRLTDNLGSVEGGDSEAWGINAWGETVGRFTAGSDGWQHAFLVGPGHLMEDVGRTRIAAAGSVLYGINEQGHLVGRGIMGSQAFACVVANNAYPAVNLNTPGKVTNRGSWWLACAQAINNAGWITGWGYYGNQVRAFLLVPNQ